MYRFIQQEVVDRRLLYKKTSLKFPSRLKITISLNSHWGWGPAGLLPKWAGKIVPGKKRWLVLCLEYFKIRRSKPRRICFFIRVFIWEKHGKLRDCASVCSERANVQGMQLRAAKW